MGKNSHRWLWLGLSILVLAPLSLADDQTKSDDQKTSTPKATVYRVPYQLTTTKHVLVRVKMNGKGPFNFVLDTGAPAIFISTEVAKKAGVEPDAKGMGTFAQFEIEGGIKLKDVEAKLEEPFQMAGMNKLNITGIRLDGFMGYTMLARFKITYDFTDTHLLWEELHWNPPPPIGLRQSGKPPANVEAMGNLSKFAAGLLGRRPDPVIEYRGFIGIELEDSDQGIRVKRVLPQSPAAQAKVQAGDLLLEFAEKEINTLAELYRLASKHAASKEVNLKVRRGHEEVTLTLQPVKGL